MAGRPTGARSRTGRLRAGLLAGACLLAAVTAAFAAETEPPVALRTSPFVTPGEMAGTGLTPEVKLRARIDARGRVAGVEVLAIAPPSEYDDLLRRATVETVEHWRYAPARADGQPVETTLEWTVQFQAEREVDQTFDRGWMRLGLSSQFDELPGTRIFTLPRKEQEEFLSRYSGIAERHLDRSRRRQVASPRFVVVSDAEEPRTAEIVAGNLEATFNLLDRILRPRIDLQPMPYKVVAYVFARHASFSALGAEVRTPEWATGLYAPPGFLAIHLEEPAPGAALSSLLHEAVHAYTERHLARPGYAPPLWLMEGLAEYLANSEIRDGELIPGRTLKHRAGLLRAGGFYRVKTDAAWSLDEVKKAVRTAEAPAIEELAVAETEVFYGEETSLHYSLSWLLVHFLRHGEPGWTDEEFPTLVLYLVEGFPPAEAIEAVYRVPPAELNPPFREYLKKF
jgi:protein TonB